MLYALRDMTFQINQEIRQALSQLRASETRFALAKEQMAAAREAHRMMLQRYALQMSSNVDVIDAKQALIQTHAAYVGVVFDIAAAQVKCFDRGHSMCSRGHLHYPEDYQSSLSAD